MIKMGKQYRTRDGREVRIYAVEPLCGSFHPVHGAVLTSTGWKSTSWDADGSYSTPHYYPEDLIEVKPRIKRDVWINVYPDEVHCLDNRFAANFCALNSRLACIKITIDCEEGEGL